MASIRLARLAWNGKARLGVARYVVAGKSSSGWAYLGMAYLGRQGAIGQEKARLGTIAGRSRVLHMGNDLRALLQEIYHQQGRLTPDIVLNEARDPSHPLHNRFEWDDDVAAEKYRLTQARALIRTARITYKDGDEFSPATRVRAFHSLPDGDGYAYRPAEEIARDPILTQIILQSMERDWKALRRRYGHFEDFMKMVQRDLENE